MPQPEFDQNLVWSWMDHSDDFGYPMSLDGHIFRTEDIFPLLSNLSFYNPNSLESILSKNPPHRTKMICLSRAPIFNIPVNKVQNNYNNRHGSISAAYLNDMFLSGYRISLKPLIGFNNIACHQEVDIRLKRNLFNAIKTIFSNN
jgi:hypothetical protein